MSVNRMIVGLVGLTILGLSSANGQAATIVNGTGLSDPAAILDFEGTTFISGQVITNQFASDGVTFSPGLAFTPQTGTFPGVLDNNLGNFGGVSGLQFSLLFADDQTEVAFGFASNPMTTTLTALFDGIVVESFSTATTFDNSPTAFLGFTGILFDEIRIDVPSIFLIDNVQLGTASTPVPLPAGAPLFLAALGLLRFLRRSSRVRSAFQ